MKGESHSLVPHLTVYSFRIRLFPSSFVAPTNRRRGSERRFPCGISSRACTNKASHQGKVVTVVAIKAINNQSLHFRELYNTQSVTPFARVGFGLGTPRRSLIIMEVWLASWWVRFHVQQKHDFLKERPGPSGHPSSSNPTRLKPRR